MKLNNERRLVVTLPSQFVRDALGDVENVDVLDWDMSRPAPVDVIDIVVAPYMGSLDHLRRLEGLNVKLVQSLSVGYDGVEQALPPNMVFANATSVHEASTSEMAVALILAAQRGLPDFVRAAAAGQWSPAWYPSLADRTVLLVGYGGVNRAVDERLRPFEVTVLRVARTERDDDRGHVYGPSSLHEQLGRADITVIGVPLTNETVHLVDDAFLSAMPDGALLVNIARGPVADTDALLDHARRGRLRLALDVTDPEPLPDGHELFTLDNVLISPHVGGATSAAMPRIVRLLRDQFARISRGEEPRNIVLRT